jgi:hypothetical protein
MYVLHYADGTLLVYIDIVIGCVATDLGGSNNNTITAIVETIEIY